jgi:predicted Fe-S protein YdhL (DUF1289 family)
MKILLEQRADQVQAEGGFAADGDGPVASPCIGVCRMTPERSHCEGCFRTLDELRIWGQADAGQRRAIWSRLLARAGLPHRAALLAQDENIL